MQCPKCQFENPEGSKFCLDCGQKFELRCPQCDKALPVSAKFCNECGNDLTKPIETAPIDYSEPQSYTPKHLTDKILTIRSSIEGERKLVTVLFADVANFTSISEKLDPEEVHQIMDGCFKVLMDEIHRYEGTINQFTGDGIMALFGAPISHEDHAQRACHVALAIQKAMNEYGQKIRIEFNVEFKLRIGLNSGPVVVGAIGDDLRMDYTAVGDTTNLAMRMESMSGAGNIQISENTYRQIKEYFYCEDLGSVPVKGKKEPQQTYKLIKSSEIQTRIEASVLKGLVRFVGRKNSMATIQSAWDKAVNGSGQILGVVGEAGVGKSRLLLEFRSSITNADFNYLEGHCLHYGGSMAYLPFLDILKTFFGVTEGQREHLINKNIKEKLTALNKEQLLASKPAFQDLLSLEVEEESWLNLEPKIKREQTFEALRNLLISLSEEKPLIIAVEDLHWMDNTSGEFLYYLIDSMAHSPVLLILLYRPEYTHQWGSKSYYSKIGLDQLTLESSVKLVSAILEGGEVASELRELILSRSAGNPLFMEEFTHTLLENGSIERENNQFVLSRKISDIQVPDTIQGIIAARMDRLEDNLKRTMQVASVIGRDFAFRILQTITGMPEELKSYLLNLQGLEFIYEKSLFPELEYLFKHALTQEVAYNSLLQKRRKEIHEKIGRAIEKLYPERLEEFYEMLAYHYCRSDNLKKACEYSRLSGDKAKGNYSHWEAYGYYKNALELLKKLPENRKNKKDKLEVIYLMCTPMAWLGFPEDSLTMVQEGERLSKDLGENRRLAELYNAMGIYYSFKGKTQLGKKYSEDAFEEALKNQDIELMVPLSFNLYISYHTAGEYYKIVDTAPKVIELIEKAERETDFFSQGINPYSNSCSYCGHCMGELGYFEEGEQFLVKGLRNASKINELLTLAMVEMMYGFLFFNRGNWETASDHFQNSINHSEAAKVPFLSATALSALGYACSLLGDPMTGTKHAENALEIYRDSGIEMNLSLLHYYLGSIHLDLGDLVDSQRLIEEALRLSLKNNEKSTEGIIRILLGRILGKIEPTQIDKAGESILKGMEILHTLKIKPDYSQGSLILGELYLDAGEKEKALKYLKEAEESFQQMGMDYWLTRTQEILGRL